MNHQKNIRISRMLLAASGLTLFIIGLLGNSFAQVLQKATSICLECIGIG